MYDIQLFGPLQVRTRGLRLSGRDFGAVKPRHILAPLALHGAMHKAELTEMLWDGRPPANHVATVESHVALLRHRLDPSATARDSVITTRNGGYALVAEQVRVDVARFDELVAAASARAVALDPVAERGWFITMDAHRELGDRVAALRAYDRCRRELSDGLGVEPSAETRALFLSCCARTRP